MRLIGPIDPADFAQPPARAADRQRMLRPRYYFSLRDCALLIVSLPDGTDAQFVLYDGGGITRTIAFWKLGTHSIALVLAADA